MERQAETLLLAMVMCAALALVLVAEAEPLEADFWDCNPKPEAAGMVTLTPNCCSLEALMRKPKPIFKTWKEYVEQSGLHKLPVRVRPAAHLIAENATYLRQLDLAFQRFKALPDSDPRSVLQQMNFHCVYGYPGVIHQAGEPDRMYRTHGNWLFFPFHRWYTFFFERTLAKLVGDDSLVLPFWNWDNQSPDYQHLPNTVPFYFRDPENYPGLYHKYRDPRHRPGAEPAVVNLDYWTVVEGYAPVTPQEVARARADNNAIMRFLLDSTAKGERAPFLSDPLRLGRGKMENDGFFEKRAHMAVHFWLGDAAYGFADMGVIYHAVRDPLFFPHHANVDRLWDVWQAQEGRSNYEDDDFMNAEFYFYDENAEIVRVTVAECLNTDLLRYRHQDVENPWLTYSASASAEASPVKGISKHEPPSIFETMGGWAVDQSLAKV